MLTVNESMPDEGIISSLQSNKECCVSSFTPDRVSVLKEAKKGKLFFVYSSDVESSAYPVVSSNYHDYGKKLGSSDLSSLFSELSDVCSRIAEAFKN